jgi:hypothetical protein
MKTFAKTVLLRGVRALPPRARRIILEDVVKDTGGFEAAGHIARRLGFTGFVAEGD